MAELPQKFKKGNQVKRGKKKSLTRKIAAEFTKEEIAISVMDLFSRPISDLTEIAKDKNSSCWDYILAKAISKGDSKFIIFLVEQVVGKATQYIESNAHEPKIIQLKYSINEQKDSVAKIKDDVNGTTKKVKGSGGS